MTRVSDETLAGIGTAISGAISALQDNVDEARNLAQDAASHTDGMSAYVQQVDQRAGMAQAAADALNGSVTSLASRVSVLESAPQGGSGGGGYGPNWLAASDAPDAVKRAVKAGGGVVSSGGDDAPLLQALVNTYGNPRLTEGTFRFNAPVILPKWRHVQGSGPATYITGLNGLSGQYFLATHDHTWFSDFTLSAGSEAAGTHGINTNVTDQSGFSTGADACTIIERIVTRNIKGDAIIVQGYNNRDSKLRSIHAWNSVGRGFFLNSPDGNGHQLVAGTSGSHGLELGTSSANWHVSGKMWYSDGDGWRIAGARHTLNNVEAQDNDLAGFRLIGNLLAISNWLADSNSYSGTKYTGWHSGLEVGLLPATSATAQGSASGGYNINIGTGRAWDKNEGSRGYNQKYGVVFRSGVRGITMTNVQTGAPSDSHRNLTDGIVFLNPSDLTNAANFVTACLSNGARMSSV